MKRKIAVIVALILLLIILFQVIATANKPSPYSFAKAQKANLRNVVSETGNVIVNNSSEIYSPTNGIVEQLYVANGDTVNEGEELFTVKSTATDQERQAAYANYLTAVATLNAAKANANSYRADMYSKWKTYTDIATNSTYETDDGKPKDEERKAAEFQIAQDNWKAAEAKYADQQTAIAQAQASVNSTLLLYQATQNAVVKAPASGTIANLAITDGSTVKANTLTVSVTPALTLANFSKTEVQVALNEADATKVSPGQQVEMDINAVGDKTYKGIVVRVDSIGTNNQGVIQYNAYIEVTNPDNNVKAGMTVDVDITTKEVSDVLAVPSSAVKPYKGGRAVRVIDPKTKKLIYIPVEIGVRGEQKTEIKQGLKEGQEVITGVSNEQLKRPSLF